VKRRSYQFPMPTQGAATLILPCADVAVPPQNAVCTLPTIPFDAAWLFAPRAVLNVTTELVTATSPPLSDDATLRLEFTMVEREPSPAAVATLSTPPCTVARLAPLARATFPIPPLAVASESAPLAIATLPKVA